MKIAIQYTCVLIVGFLLHFVPVVSERAVCTSPVTLGMESRFIRNWQITASDSYNRISDFHDYSPKQGRLYNDDYWATNDEEPDDPWIQVDFLDMGNEVNIIGIKTQGSTRGEKEWITQLKIKTGDSQQSLTYITEGNGHKIFDANNDNSDDFENTVVEITFPEPISARYLRIVPIDWHDWVSLRFEVIGCQTEIPLLGPDTSQSSTYINWKADRAVDGKKTDDSCTHTNDDQHAWWKVEMQESRCVEKIVIYNRVDCCGDRLEDAIVRVGDNTDTDMNPVFGRVSSAGEVVQLTCGLRGKFISVHLENEYLTICELKAFTGDCTVTTISDIRLENTPHESPNAGRLQVLTINQWRNVCIDGDDELLGNQDWEFKEAMVACRQLGYPGTAMTSKAKFGNASGPAIAQIYCDGGEQTLDDCRCWKEKDCNDDKEVGVICTAPGYQGCFTSMAPEASWSHSTMTIAKCRQFCMKNHTNPTMTIAGLQSGDMCLCGDNDIQLGDRGTDSQCDVACQGNELEICGGTTEISIYDLTLGQCNKPDIPFGGTNETDYSFGKWVTFECDTNYELHGNTTLQCVLGDTPDECKWSGDLPSCQKSYPQPQKRLSTGTIIGAVIGSILALILLVVSVLFLFRLRRNHKETEPKSTVLAFYGPYDITISSTPSTQLPIYVNTPEEHTSPRKAPGEEIYYSTVGTNAPDNKDVSVVYTKPHKSTPGVGDVSPKSQKKEKENPSSAEEGSLYYATSNTQEGVGWEDNVAYDSLDSGGAKFKPRNGTEGEEGWKANTLYAVHEVEKQDTTKWMDNTIYAGSDDE